MQQASLVFNTEDVFRPVATVSGATEEEAVRTLLKYIGYTLQTGDWKVPPALNAWVRSSNLTASEFMAKVCAGAFERIFIVTYPEQTFEAGRLLPELHERWVEGIPRHKPEVNSLYAEIQQLRQENQRIQMENHRLLNINRDAISNARRLTEENQVLTNRVRSLLQVLQQLRAVINAAVPQTLTRLTEDGTTTLNQGVGATASR